MLISTATFPPAPTAATSGRPRARRGKDYGRSADRPPTLDLELRHLDVRRISRADPTFRACLRAGWEVDDLDAEVMLRVYARQSMPSRYDPARSCVSKYLTVLIGGILRNLLRKMRHERSLPTYELDADDAGAVLAPVDDTAPLPESEPDEPLEDPMAVSVIPVPDPEPTPPPKPPTVEAQVEVADVLVTVRATVPVLVDFVRALAAAGATS